MANALTDRTSVGSARAEAEPEKQHVTSEGEPLRDGIEGVVLRTAVTHADDRGELVEIYDPAWGVHPDPLAYAYLVTIRPGKVKGWVVHDHQDDRIFVAFGTVRIALYDDRVESPTHGQVEEFFIGERNRALITIPKGVFHAVQNVGLGDAAFMNLPTHAYKHAQPDKRRLPLDTPLIPYSFAAR